MEHQRLGLQIWCLGLCWWRARRDRLRHVCTCLLSCAGQASGENDGQLSTPQRLVDRVGDRLLVVRMVGIQWWLSIRRQPESCASLLEHQFDCHVRRRDLVNLGLEISEEMVDGRMVLRSHLRACRCHSCIWLLHRLGIGDPWCRYRRCM